MSVEDETWEGLTSPPKRKRDVTESAAEPSVQKPPKKKKKKRKGSLQDDSIDDDGHVDISIGQLDPQLLADLLAKQNKRFAPDLSLVELEDRRIPAHALVDTTAWPESRSLEKLPDFLRRFATPDSTCKDLAGAPPENGAPHTIVVAGSAIRAADVTRRLRAFQSKEATVAKLFAKHIKMSEATSFVQKTRLSMGAGTPTRIADLFDANALKANRLQQIVIDCSYIDQKRRSILNMKETHTSMVDLLNSSQLKARWAAEKQQLKIIFF